MPRPPPSRRSTAWWRCSTGFGVVATARSSSRSIATVPHVHSPIEAAAVVPLYGGLAQGEARPCSTSSCLGGLHPPRHRCGWRRAQPPGTRRVVINPELPWSPTRPSSGSVGSDASGRQLSMFGICSPARPVRSACSIACVRLADARSEFDVADPPGVAGRRRRRPWRRTDTVHPNEGRSAGRRRAERVSRRHAREARFDRAGAKRCMRGRLAPPAFARGRLRHWLRARALVLLRSTIEDGASRPVAIQFTGLLRTMDAVRICSWRRVVTGLVESGARLSSSGRFIDGWERDSLRCHTALWHAQLAREDAILDALRARPESDLQPGLFDRRAERACGLDPEEGLLIDQITTRRALAVRAAGAQALRVDPVLILLPPN